MPVDIAAALAAPIDGQWFSRIRIAGIVTLGRHRRRTRSRPDGPSALANARDQLIDQVSNGTPGGGNMPAYGMQINCAEMTALAISWSHCDRRAAIQPGRDRTCRFGKNKP